MASTLQNSGGARVLGNEGVISVMKKGEQGRSRNQIAPIMMPKSVLFIVKYTVMRFSS
jgi:hypothetical protein